MRLPNQHCLFVFCFRHRKYGIHKARARTVSLKSRLNDLFCRQRCEQPLLVLDYVCLSTISTGKMSLLVIVVIVGKRTSISFHWPSFAQEPSLFGYDRFSAGRQFTYYTGYDLRLARLGTFKPQGLRSLCGD